MGKGKKIRNTNIPSVKLGTAADKEFKWKGPMPKHTLSYRKKGQKELWENPPRSTISNILTFKK
jgi:hypothetical protein